MPNCNSCHWWFRYDKRKKWGDCVLITGSNGAPKAKTKISKKHPFKCLGDFGYNLWEPDKRNLTEILEATKEQ